MLKRTCFIIFKTTLSLSSSLRSLCTCLKLIPWFGYFQFWFCKLTLNILNNELLALIFSKVFTIRLQKFLFVVSVELLWTCKIYRKYNIFSQWPNINNVLPSMVHPCNCIPEVGGWGGGGLSWNGCGRGGRGW